jgi:very-short-patch-repair endonuclease
MGVLHVHVENGVYESGLNIPEANEVLLQVKNCMAKYPDQSIGIVTTNSKQMEYLQDELNRLKDNDKIISEYFEKWDDDDVEYPLLQNLERVQGSERDIIIISTVYGRDEKRDMYQRFPLINTKFGHRRLNVLFTRAKNRLILVTSLRPSDIHVNSGIQNRGKTILKEYIEYASFSPVSQPYQEIKETDSDFEVSVMTALKDYGFDLTPQVGVKGFRIDIGVKHPNFKYGFLAGIECDGATYHSSPSARERDSIRQDILESLGWKIYRIWSTDWFDNPSKEV